MPYKHTTVFLQEHTPEMLKELDALSRDGWEFVAWLTDWLDTTPTSRMALMRRPDSSHSGTVPQP